MPNSQNDYKKNIKSTLVFGGAQVIQMLITILRSKFIAIFLGSAGMGVNAIFQSTLSSINTFSSFGIFQSAVRDISQAHASGDAKNLAFTKAVFERIVCFTGILGMLICMLFAPVLSRVAFEDDTYTWSFVLLAFALPFMALANGKTVFLQGTRHLTYLAKASLIGAFVSLAVGIPLYYYLDINGIVISIVLGYFLFYLTKKYYTDKIVVESTPPVSFKELVSIGKPMLKLGFVLMVGVLSVNLFTFLTNIAIGRIGSIEDLGLFQSASSITSQSIVVVMAIMASDFFPRLSAVCTDTPKVRVMVNQQLELILLIIAPIVLFIVFFTPFIVRVLLSEEFLVIVPILRSMALALLVRGVWITMSYIILAKGDRKSYLIYDALIGNGLNFILNIVSYYYWGLYGLGISFIIGSLVMSLVLIALSYFKYEFRFEKYFYFTFGFLVLLCVSAYFSVLFLNGLPYYFCLVLIISLFLIFAAVILNKRLNLSQVIKRKFIK